MNPQFDEKHTIAVNILLGRFITYRRGDTVPHEVVEQVTGLNRNDGLYRYIVKCVRQKMLSPEYGGIAIRGIPDVGFHLQTLREQVKDPMRDRKAARQQLRKQRELEALPDKDLSEYDRRLKSLRIAHSKKSRSQIRADMKIEDVLFKPTDALPRPECSAPTEHFDPSDTPQTPNPDA